MKKIYLNIVSIILCMTMITGCDNEENISVSDLQILASEIHMDATGGKGYVEISSSKTVSARLTDTGWCSIEEITDNKITINTQPNYGYSGRSSQLVITDGVKEEKLTVMQSGAVFVFEDSKWIQRVTNAATTLHVKQYGSFPCIVNIPEEARNWLSYKEDDNGKGGTFIITQNTSNNIRAAKITVTNGNRDFEYQILQYEVDDMLGTWNGQYTNDFQTYYALKDVKITKEEDGTYSVANLANSQPYTLRGEAENNTLTFEAGQYLGKMYDMFYLGLAIQDTWGEMHEAGYKIGLGPVILADGTIGLMFDDTIGEYPSIAFYFIAYIDEFLDEAYGAAYIFANCLLYK